MQKPESIVQIIHTHVPKFENFFIDYVEKTLCTHIIFTVKWKNTQKKKVYID